MLFSQETGALREQEVDTNKNIKNINALEKEKMKGSVCTFIKVNFFFTYIYKC